MAIDSVAKRFSIMDMDNNHAVIVPDGTIDGGDRQHLLMLYSGIAADAGGGGGGGAGESNYRFFPRRGRVR